MARLSDRVVTGAPNGILSNDEPIQWYAADGITLIDGIKVDATDAVYLAPAGGLTKVGTGGFNLPNNTPLRGTTSSGGTARMVQMSATNVIEVGATAQALELNATTTTVNSDLTVTGNTTTPAIGLGTSTLANATTTWQHQVQGDTLAFSRYDTTGTSGSNAAGVQLFNEGALVGGVQYSEATGRTFLIAPDGGQNIYMEAGSTTVGTDLTVTGNIEASERIRLGNNKLLQARNQQNTQWRSVLTVDTNNDLVIGSSATPITLDVDTTVDGNLDVTGTTTGSGYLYLSSKTANQGLRLNNTTKIQSWNPAGTVLRDLMELDANEDVRIGSSANDIYLDNDTTVTGDLGVSGAINAVGIIESGTYSNVGATSGCKIFQSGTVTISTTSTSTINRINFYNPNGQVGRIRTTGTATQYVTSSDPRLKSEFTPITGASEMILEARDQGMIGEFTFLADPTQTIWGYNAHKLIDAQPNFGGSEGEGSRDAPLGDDVTPAGVDQSKRVPILEAAIGELLDRIKVLEEAGVK